MLLLHVLVDWLEGLGVDESNIKMSFKEIGWDRRAWTGFICLRIGQLLGLCEHGNELKAIKCREFLD
jgi:hypothetical protein